MDNDLKIVAFTSGAALALAIYNFIKIKNNGTIKGNKVINKEGDEIYKREER